MGLHKLERLHEPKGFFDTTAHGQVVDAHVFDHAVWVDDEQAPGRGEETDVASQENTLMIKAPSKIDFNCCHIKKCLHFSNDSCIVKNNDTTLVTELQLERDAPHTHTCSQSTWVRCRDPPAAPRSLWKSACWGRRAGGCGCDPNRPPVTQQITHVDTLTPIPCTTAERDFLLQEDAYLPRGVCPSQVGEVRIHRHAHHLAVDVMELTGLVAERNDLCWTHEGAAMEQRNTTSDEQAHSILHFPLIENLGCTFACIHSAIFHVITLILLLSCSLTFKVIKPDNRIHLGVRLISSALTPILMWLSRWFRECSSQAQAGVVVFKMFGCALKASWGHAE